MQSTVLGYLKINDLKNMSRVNKITNALAHDNPEYHVLVMAKRFLDYATGANGEISFKDAIKADLYLNKFGSEKNISLSTMWKARSNYCEHMAYILTDADIHELVQWALSNQCSLQEKKAFLDFISEHSKWMRQIPVNDFAELFVRVGYQHQLGQVANSYEKATGISIFDYIKENIPDANQRIVGILLKEAFSPNAQRLDVHKALTYITNRPELLKHLSIKDAAELFIQVGNQSRLGVEARNYEKATGISIFDYIKENIPDANQRIVKILVKSALLPSAQRLDAHNALAYITNRPELVKHLTVQDAAELFIQAGYKGLGIEARKYEEATGVPIFDYIKNKVPDANQRIVKVHVKDALLPGMRMTYATGILNYITYNPELAKHLTPKDAAELFIRAGGLDLIASLEKYWQATSISILDYIKNNVPDANKRIVKILVENALFPDTSMDFIEKIFGHIINNPELAKYFSPKDAADIYSRISDENIAATMRREYKAMTGKNIYDYTINSNETMEQDSTQSFRF